MIDKNSLIRQASDFLTRAFNELERNQFFLEEHWHIDHLCYRASTEDGYLVLKNKFSEFSKLLIESEVNGRLISTFKLSEPIVFKNWEIDLIELPAPKKGKMVADGFEHFEIVCDLSFDEIKSRYPQGQFDESGLSKDFNQELELEFNGFAVKFHHLSLQSVINLETKSLIFSALKQSNILKELKPFGPLIAGTFPLNLDVAGSDVDILISAEKFEPVKKLLQEKFGHLLDFKYKEMSVQNEPTFVASFSYQGIDFGIFAQKTKAVRQQGYLHFLVEERLLKIGGETFANKIKQAREQGLKTEPAFAQVIGLSGDPFQELLMLQKKSNKTLKALLKAC